MGTRAATAGAVLQRLEALLLNTVEPLVAGGTADVVAAAELGKGEVGDLGFENEAGTFGFHGRCSPRHRALRVEGGP
jgi:hypothetical protein